MDTQHIMRKKKALYSSFSSKKLQLILFPTEQCNFRCTYCYEDFSIGKMKPHVVDGVDALIKARAKELELLHLEFFGGEPLLTPDIIERLCTTARKMQEENPQLKYGATATTNGALLTRNRFEKYSDLGLRGYQISLDGEGETHDKTRRRANGRGTFAQIWRNLKAIARSDYPGRIMLRVHLLPTNVQSVYALIDRINAELDDPRFELNFKAVGYWGGDNDGDFEIFRSKSEELQQIMSRLREKLTGRIVQAETTAEDAHQAPEICYASKANSLAIRADGRIGKCTVALNDPRNSIGKIHSDGTLDIDRAKLAPWLQGFDDFDLAALACPLHRFPALKGAQRRSDTVAASNL